MSIAEHVHSLQQHLAQYGLYPVPADADRGEAEVFKICFLNKYEMQRWQAMRESELETGNAADTTSGKVGPYNGNRIRNDQ